MGIEAMYTCPRQHLTTNHTTKAYVDNSTNFINNSTQDKPYMANQSATSSDYKTRNGNEFLVHQGANSNYQNALLTL
jgi:hypothetical protein